MKPLQKIVRNFGTSSANLKKTGLYEYHKNVIGGKMIEFAGYELPVQYKDLGVMKEHMACRESGACFDVSHMGQLKVRGKDAADFLEVLTVGNIRGIKDMSGSLSLILNENAGIIDDTIISTSGDHYKMVVNGANKEKDLKHINKILEDQFKGKDVNVEVLDDYQLLALQGPKAKFALGRLCDQEFHDLKFGMHTHTVIKSINAPVTVFRMGYTGEDGFEISVHEKYVEKLFDILLEQPEIVPAGLGARDSLRLEAGLCLHGNDMTEQTTPAQCALMWTVRKNDQGQQKFIGRQALTKQRKEGIPNKRVGFVLTQKGIIRPPNEVFSQDGQKIGDVTSGVFSPILQQGIGMCFVHPDYAKIGTEILIRQRNKDFTAKVVKMPFVANNYYK
ncbi:hypothetical protein PPERSA_00012 [Pseudocohnilembus persalinus]|uniref:Aminomethyltransferase n=1 Tax=Pseudocohnilembus persalinus TaxID=266149 RepID=A0A0V0QV86_PSEPJ|nr:hypothetical protein PPERSA_00012 [Pseudocohnilembus persalinus]|eukprot:KRX06132.1 hypothetical protein PPERSA_00012 [Pseudocohnilembus persalinus]